MGKHKIGKLVVLEGIDGAGKSTIGKFLYEELSRRGISCVFTREPTDGRYGRELRERIKKGNLTPQEELDLFLKDREEHVKNFIVPQMERGKLIICDRYYLSNCAYQGARGIDPEEILKKNRNFPAPDLVIFLDIIPEKALERKKNLLTHFENRDFLRRVRELYLKILPLFRFVNINASNSLGFVKKLALSAVLDLINEG